LFGKLLFGLTLGDGLQSAVRKRQKLAASPKSPKSDNSGPEEEVESDNSEGTKRISAAVKEALKPWLEKFVTKEEFASLAARADLERAVSQVRRQGVLDAAQQVAQICSAIQEKQELAAAHVSEAAAAAKDRINGNSVENENEAIAPAVPPAAAAGMPSAAAKEEKESDSDQSVGHHDKRQKTDKSEKPDPDNMVDLCDTSDSDD